MKYLSEKIWNDLDFPDFRPRFFIEAFTEIINIKTPHFLQSRYHNIFSICYEMKEYISNHKITQKNSKYLIETAEEMDYIMKNDDVSEEILKTFENTRIAITKKIISGDLSKYTLESMVVICDAIISKQERYEDELINKLINIITEDVDLSKKERITKDINRYTKLYISLLLNRGFSPTYLFSRMQLLNRKNNYKGRDLKEQLCHIFTKLKNYKNDYQIFFSFKSAKPESIELGDFSSNVELHKNIVDKIEKSHIEKLKMDFEPDGYFSVNLISTDYISAAWKAKEIISNLLDSLMIFQIKQRIKISEKFVSISNINGTNYHNSTSIDDIIQFSTSENGTLFSRDTINIKLLNEILNKNAKDKIGRSFRYYRLARNSISLEQKFLNLWISLESLFNDEENNILDNLLEYVPLFYGITSIERRIEYLKNGLIINKAPMTPLVKELLGKKNNYFNMKNSLNDVFKILKDEATAIELFESLDQKEHLKYRLLHTFKELKKNKDILERIKRSKLDVSRQLRRIYYLRNRIAHTGFHTEIKPQIITHLIDYLSISYYVLIYTAETVTSDNEYSIRSLFMSYKLGTENFLVNELKEITIYDELKVNPVI